MRKCRRLLRVSLSSYLKSFQPLQACTDLRSLSTFRKWCQRLSSNLSKVLCHQSCMENLFSSRGNSSQHVQAFHKVCTESFPKTPQLQRLSGIWHIHALWLQI